MSAKRPKADKPREKPAKKTDDVVLIQGISEDGDALAVLRARDNRLEAGIVRSVRSDETPRGELVKLKPRPQCPLLCDVEVEVPENTLNARGGSDDAAHERGPARSVSHHGPAQVATPSYRANWDAIWKKPNGKKSLPN